VVVAVAEGLPDPNILMPDWPLAERVLTPTVSELELLDRLWAVAPTAPPTIAAMTTSVMTAPAIGFHRHDCRRGL
jgi:hypothetical protein